MTIHAVIDTNVLVSSVVTPAEMIQILEDNGLIEKEEI